MVAAGRFTALMHLEHNVEVTWAALQAWAADSALLEPLGFRRGFVRTEIAPWSGRAMAVDAEVQVHTRLLRCLSLSEVVSMNVLCAPQS